VWALAGETVKKLTSKIARAIRLFFTEVMNPV
jgi:hypothetical protein